MIKYHWYQSGKIFGILYKMQAGDALPTHSHDEETAHNVIVLEGVVELITPGCTTFHALGDIVDFDGKQMHTIRAVVNAVILNLFLNGMPESYRGLPDSERSGAITNSEVT
jgi:hypothetical protein